MPITQYVYEPEITSLNCGELDEICLNLIPQLRELVAHAQVPRHDPVPLNPGNEGVKPVQQQLSYSGFTKVFDAAIQPPLESVRLIGP